MISTSKFNDDCISFVRLFIRECRKLLERTIADRNSDIQIKLPKSTIIGHKGIGIIIGNHVKMGESVTIRQNVTIGGRGRGMVEHSHKERSRQPTIEDRVSIGCGATILGGITIGKGSIIGAGAVVITNIPPYSVVVGVPGRVIGKVKWRRK